MSFSPPTLKALAAYWVKQGGVNLGIVGDTAHLAKGTSYHLGKDDLAVGAYSARLARDKAGLTNAASAIDLGRLDGKLTDLRAFSRWFAHECQDNYKSPIWRDVREVIYWSTVRNRVVGWSALAPTTFINDYGDLSHKTHTHISFYRDSEFREKISLFKGYFPTVVTPPTTPATGEVVNSFVAPKVPTNAVVKTGAWLHVSSALVSDAANVQIDPGRGLLYLGAYSPTVEMVSYNGKGMFVLKTDVTSYAPIAGDPVAIAKLQSDLVLAQQQAAAAKTAEAAAQLALSKWERYKAAHSEVGL